MFEFLIRGKIDIFTISTSVFSAGTLAHTVNTLVKMLKICSFGWSCVNSLQTHWLSPAESALKGSDKYL